jgi:hypothetical protein
MRQHEGSIADGVNDNDLRRSWIPVLAIAAVGSFIFLIRTAASAAAADSSAKPLGTNPFPLSTELAVLERDLSSGVYRAVLATMNPTDLEAERQRVATSDHYLDCAKQHGLEQDARLYFRSAVHRWCVGSSGVK